MWKRKKLKKRKEEEQKNEKKFVINYLIFKLNNKFD